MERRGIECEFASVLKRKDACLCDLQPVIPGTKSNVPAVVISSSRQEKAKHL